MTAIWEWLVTPVRRLSFRAHRTHLDDELREEMQFHLDMLARDNEARGMSSETAREAAQRQFGSATMLREASRDHWSLGWLDAIWEDIRYSVRSLARTPGITLTALITITLGIGATTTVVALLEATLLHPIALRDVDRIVTICQINTGSDCQHLSPGNYVSVRDAQTVFQSVALSQYWPVTVPGPTAATVGTGAVVTPNYFLVLGVTPILGRSFTQADADASASSPTVVILSYAFWVRYSNADPGIIGRSVVLNGVPRTVVGVLGKDDGFPTDADVWGPLRLSASEASNRERVNSAVFGRLRPGATAADAARDVAAIQRRIIRESPATNAGWRFVTAPLKEFRTGEVRQAILLVVAAVAGVLLIACTNVANLLFVRAAAREREISVRAALGAGRAQVARQLVIEGVLLSLSGGALGVVLGEMGVISLKNSVPAYMGAYLPGWNTMNVNWHVLMMMLGVCIVVGVGFSAFPALRAARTDLTGALKQTARGSTGGRRIGRVRLLPLSNSNSFSNFIPDSRPTLQLMQAQSARDEFVTPSYFAVMGIPTVSGRNFNESNGDSATSVVIVNRILANRYWPGGDAIGHTIRMGGGK